jgi:fructose-1,6-bisphosphatase/sedoheptulose 1,7-bisphosphatase-like protein
VKGRRGEVVRHAGRRGPRGRRDARVDGVHKIAAGAEDRGVLELEKPIGENIRALAAAKGKNLEDMVVAVLDRPRHDEMIRQIRATGAGTRLLLDGDVAGGISATLPGSMIDMCVGVGGTPEASSRRARSRRSVV